MEIVKAREVVVNNIKKLRESLNLDEGEFGRRIGKSESFIKKLEANKYTREVNITLLIRISEVYDIDIRTLFDGVSWLTLKGIYASI